MPLPMLTYRERPARGPDKTPLLAIALGLGPTAGLCALAMLPWLINGPGKGRAVLACAGAGALGMACYLAIKFWVRQYRDARCGIAIDVTARPRAVYHVGGKLEGLYIDCGERALWIAYPAAYELLSSDADRQDESDIDERAGLLSLSYFARSGEVIELHTHGNRWRLGPSIGETQGSPSRLRQSAVLTIPDSNDPSGSWRSVRNQLKQPGV